MANIIEQYLSLSPREQRLVRVAAAVDVPGALSLLELYFPEVTPPELQTLKEYIAANRPPT